jgi:tetratricopeptide (TPR) repeat protein/predicted Ser/Thr protein kinase
MTDPLVGTAVAHYEVLAKLGGGGMGVVYTARDVRLGRLVALKFLPPQWSHDESAKQRFLREAQAASATHHRNICTIHDIETAADGQLFIVMAYYEGQTLKQKLEAGPLAIEEAVEIAAQVAEGLAKAHAEGVVHRDIKPGNLIIVEDDVKILDFGLAKFANALQLTMEGSTLGTVAYMSPEQTRGEEADARSDIWAVGVVLYEMLAGALPFKGAYPEAISHAIRNDPVPSMRIPGREIPPELIRIIERALAKEPEGRFQSVRELARDLRLLQGRTIPLDLLTAPINAPALRIAPRRRWWRSRAALAAAAIAIIAGVGAPLWIFAPVARVPVVVAPVVNQTGYAELDAYRSALTEELIAELSDSAAVRVLSYDRELQILRRFRTAGRDISSREAIQALTANSGARIVIAPTLLYENGAWRARGEFRDTATATNAAVRETAPVVSSLVKETAYQLMPQLTAGIEAHFISTGPRRARIAYFLRSLIGWTPAAPAVQMGTLDAAAEFERGLDASERLEYGAALRFFDSAAQLDSRSPLPVAWRSRVAHIMRRDDEAAEGAEQARRLMTAQLSGSGRTFLEAVIAESQGDAATADARYHQLAQDAPDEVRWAMELGAFQDRRNLNADSVVSYQHALSLDPRLIRPHLELCRLYNRLNETADAKTQGQQALAQYRAIADGAGEVQSLFCLSDAFRVGGAEDRKEARRLADAALMLLQTNAESFQLPRAHYYVGNAAYVGGQLSEAIASWQESVTRARAVDNRSIQPLDLMNIGVTYERLGQRALAASYFGESSKAYERLGDEARAAQNQANSGALLVEYGDKPQEGLRDLENALAVSRKLGDRNFEAFCLQVIAAYYRYAGRHAEAERTFNQAIAISRERDLQDDIALLTIDVARSRFDRADYASARDLFVQAMGDGSGPRTTDARIRLARVDVRLGDFHAATQELKTAETEFAAGHGDRNLAPLLEVVRGELALASGAAQDSRAYFERAAAVWVDDRPDAAAVEARAYLGLLDTRQGRTSSARQALESSLVQAGRMGRYGLEVRCRVYLAQLDVSQRQFAAAADRLRNIPADGERALGPELQAQVHYWRSQALKGIGEVAGSKRDEEAARRFLRDLTTSLPEKYRPGFAARADLLVPVI